jgi:hypothetical protein
MAAIDRRSEITLAHMRLPKSEADGAFRSRLNNDLNNASSTKDMQRKIDQ